MLCSRVRTAPRAHATAAALAAALTFCVGACATPGGAPVGRQGAAATAAPADFASLQPGATFPLGGFDPLASALSPATAPSSGAGVELYSDCPETVSASGVLYDDDVSGGLARVYVYHETSGAARRYSVVLTDVTGQGAAVRIARAGIGGPDTKYPYLGKVALARFLASGAPSAGATVQVPPGGHAILDPTLDGVVVPSGYVVNAIYDLQVSGTVKISVVTVGASDDTLAAYPSLSLEPPDSKNRRGTFAPSDIDFTVASYDTAQGPASLDLADNAVVAASGVQQTPSSQPLVGQYGILSHVSVAATASDGAKLAVFLAPRGGGDFETSAVAQGSVVELPSGTGSASTSQGIFVGLYDPTAGAIDVTTSLAGGSSGPFRLVLYPVGGAASPSAASPTAQSASAANADAGADAAADQEAADAAADASGDAANDAEPDAGSPYGVATGQACDPTSDFCSDFDATCEANDDGDVVCCIPNGTASTAGDGSDCCSGGLDPSTGNCGGG
jgi:hypothetical protein